MKLHYGRKTLVTVSLLLVAGCGAFNKKKSDDGTNNNSQDDLVQMLEDLFTNDETPNVKLVEAKTETGQMVSRDTYQYSDKTTTQHIQESYDDSGKLTDRTTHNYGVKSCDDDISTYETFGSSPRKSISKTVHTCVNDQVVQSKYIDMDGSGRQNVTRTTTYTYDDHGDQIKKVIEVPNQSTVTTETAIKRDGKGRTIEELETVNGKNSSKRIRDFAAGTDITMVPAKGASDFTVEKYYHKNLPKGLQPLLSMSGSASFGYYSEARSLDDYDREVSKCVATSNGGGQGLQCSLTTSGVGEYTSSRTKETTVIPYLVQLKNVAKFKELFGDDAENSLQGNAVIFSYLPTKEVEVYTDSSGVKTTTTTTATYNAKFHLVHQEESSVTDAGKKSLTVEDRTYDADGAKVMSKTVTKDGVKTIYTYSY